jgi:hypothetical protein
MRNSARGSSEIAQPQKLWLCSFFADSTADEAERLIEASATRLHRDF